MRTLPDRSARAPSGLSHTSSEPCAKARGPCYILLPARSEAAPAARGAPEGEQTVDEGTRSDLIPCVFGMVAVVIGAWLSFVVFW